MALLWTVFASFLMASCLANARSVGKSTFQTNKVNDEDTDINTYRVKGEEDHTLEARGYGFSGCQMGTAGQYCWPHGVCKSRKFHIHFPRHFAKKPTVSVSLAGLDVDKNYNLRAYSSPVSVTTSSFDIDYSTWADTQVHGIKFSWVACA